jgi:LacI family transcriptional regulator, repressor for deo operon, udp, cdd, tsx, nupC, and nupG
LSMITIKDIAQQLNLSASTVGRALADHPRISRATKERVGIAADRLGYVASTPARVMRGGSSHLVGLLVPDIHNHFYSLVAHGLSKCFKDDGLHLALSITDDDPDTEVERVREMVSARVAGIVIVPSASPRRETLKLLKLVPHIQLLRHAPAFRADWFGMNDEGALFDATNHLLSLGHRRISYVGDVIFSTGRARYEGFRRACAQAGIQPEEALVELGPPTVSFGAAALSRLLEQSIPPTALLTASVPVTLGVVEQLEALEVAVPGTLSIIGFGDEPWQKWWRSGLTTIRLPVEQLATSCGLWFRHCLHTARRTSSDEPHVAICPCVFVPRGSTGPPPTIAIEAG